jgi:hypothetical protein
LADDAALRQDAIQRVLSSAGFQRSHRLSQLLSYIADRTLERDFEALKESAIGHQVFARSATYNSADDTIVRVSVRQLRRKLEDYYTTEGVGDKMRVTIPKGSYALSFQLADCHTSETAEPPAFEAGKPGRFWPFATTAIIATCMGALLAALFLPPRRETLPRTPTAVLSLLTPASGQRLLVVVPDFGIQLYRQLTGQTLSLQDYVARRFVQPASVEKLPAEIRRSADRLFSDPATQAFVLDLIPRFATIIPPAALSVRHPSTLSVEDFTKDNALLISGPNGDPWVQLFDRALNFQIVNDLDRRRSHIENRQPRGSEQKEYYNYTDASGTVACFARIAYLRGLSHTSHILLAGGPHNASTEAASRFLTSPDSLPALLKLFHVATPQQLPSFEILVRSRALGNAPWTMTIEAARTITDKDR